MTHIDLCCGMGGWQAPFRESDNWRTVGFDVRRDLSPDVQADVCQLPVGDCDVTLVTASPPCIEFTKWKLPWYGGGACDGDPSMDLVGACLREIHRLQPQWWCLENVVGLSMYWRPSDKCIGPYHLWGDFPPFDAETVWKQQRLQPKDQRSELSAKIPYHIADSLRRAVEVWT